jgi:hypothetical protein
MKQKTFNLIIPYQQLSPQEIIHAYTKCKSKGEENNEKIY